jgi:Lrp/AsnC family transcriptional regulator for asnA, asnC and gidA
MGKIDEIDMKILNELVKDASISVPKLSKKIGVNTSVVYSRIKRLMKRGLIRKYTVVPDEEQLGLGVTALIGINIDPKKRNDVIKALAGIDTIKYISEVTGRFDIIALLKIGSLADLRDLIADKVGNIDGVTHTETFIEMKKTEKEIEYKLPR